MKPKSDTPMYSPARSGRLSKLLLLLLCLGSSSRTQASDLGLTETDCRCCHGPIMADRHHLLVTKSSFECLTCHQMVWNPTLMAYEATVTRNCPQCHTGSLADRHHLLVDQVTYTCFTCHSVIWDPVSMMYMPVFNNSCNMPPSPVSLATINGTVTNAAGAGLGWAQVAAGSGQYFAVTTTTGAYQLADLPPGTYGITASLPGYVSASQSITVMAGQAAIVNFVLASVAAPATIAGLVVDPTQTPVQGANVFTSDGVYSTLTDADGAFILSDVIVGSYTLTVQKDGYGSSSQSVSVTAGQDLATQFALPNTPVEICGDGLDNDGNGLIDCADPVCVGTAACPPPVEICGDGLDNDGNGLADCADLACSGTAGCPPPVAEICGDGIDNDENGFADCKDPACDGSSVCQTPNREICGDGIDNDDNGVTDCRDPACIGTPACPPPTPENCHDHKDNNGDGLVDCADPLCFGSHRCLYERCGDGVDNDRNGLTDCADPVCAKTSKCQRPPVDICNDGLDNDGDGLADCADPKCASKSICAHSHVEEICDNQVDDNADGFVDCADAQCKSRKICLTEICGNGLDDDLDGHVDCADPNCVSYPACVVPPTPLPLPFLATASEAVAGYGVGNLADGSMSTHWSTNRKHDTWVRLDLGGLFRVSEVDIHWYNNEHATDFRVKVSKDGRYWRTVGEIDNGVGGLDAVVFAAREARYVLIDLESPARLGFSINEVVVFQAPSSAGLVRQNAQDSGSAPASGNALTSGNALASAKAVVAGTDGGVIAVPLSSNLALNATVVSSDPSVGAGAQKAVDGKMATRWKVRGDTEQWIRVDLGSVLTIGEVVIHWHRKYAEDYKLKVSADGTQWEIIADLKHGSGGRESLHFAPRAARYVQIDCDYAAQLSSNGPPLFSIFEVEVYQPPKARNLP